MSLKKPGGYVEHVLEDTRSYIRELLSENRRLTEASTGLETTVARMEEENRRLRAAVQDAKAEAARRGAEANALQRRLDEIEHEQRDVSERYLVIEQQSANLASLYVASHRIHGTLDHALVLDAVLEIVVNLIGSEEVAVVERDGEGWRVSAAFGGPWAPGDAPSGAADPVWKALDAGQPFIAENGAGPGGVTAAVPLRVEDQVTGALIIWALLGQKRGLEALDHELLDLLGSQAAVALHCTRSLKQGVA